MSGYALALAQQAGLSPEEAAYLWAERVYGGYHARGESSSEELEHLAMHAASIMEMMFGNVLLKREGAVWTAKSVIVADKPDLERWGVAVESWARWVTVIDRYVGELVGVDWADWLDGDNLYARLSPRR